MPLDLTTSIRNSQSPTSDTVADRLGSLHGPVHRLVDERLWPAAAEVDRGDSLPVDHFAALAELGLFGMAIPREAGGLGLTPPQVRAVLRLLGSGCGVTAFAFAQHHGTAGAVASTSNHELRQRWLPELVSDTLAGIAYAHVRRRGTPALTAEPSGDGWVLDGTAPWVTSWGVAHVIGVAANTADGRLLWCLIPAVEGDGLSAGTRFDLMVYRATQTVALRFDRFPVRPDQVLSVVAFDTWAGTDRLLAARPNPLCIGIGDRALAQLGSLPGGADDAFGPWWSAVTRRSEQHSLAVDDAGRGTAPPGLLEQTAGGRAECLLAVQRLCTALIATVGGAAMDSDHWAQRLSREAYFYVIQAQSADGRAALLDRLHPGADEPGHH